MAKRLGKFWLQSCQKQRFEWEYDIHREVLAEQLTVNIWFL